MKIENKNLGEEEFDFAFSFAGEDRVLVEEIKNRLSKKGLKIFYDSEYQAQLVGMDLYKTLRDIYMNHGKFVVCFISEHYAKKTWTNLEFSAIKERLMETFFAESFLIPILIGNVEMLEDIPNFIGFYQHKTVDETVAMLREKVGSFVEEDILISDLTNFISHLRQSVLIELCKQYSDIAQVNDALVIKGQKETLSIRFSHDSISQSPCVLAFVRNENESEDIFPAFVITWSKIPHLCFSICVFSELTNSLQTNLRFSGIVAEICHYVERHIGDCL